ncbi:hypothetical protein [Oxobacter pfennigii]|uniref:hypothetical protein n=1 Tax=Oxobacter pfennigii TaxID=36849 RepID=UPI0006D3FBB2|nr:hypothetical protein [Oxobacter pfennigii]
MGSSKYKKYIEEDSYYNRELKFYIEKPKRWIFVPQHWIESFKLKDLERKSELKERLRRGAMPFIYFYMPHNNYKYPFPAVRCACRLKRGTKKIKFLDHTRAMIRALDSEFENFEIVEQPEDCIISGHRGIILRSRFTLKNHYGKDIEYLSRIVIINGTDFVYMIVLTGSMEGEYYCEEEFTQSIQSIKIM